jgi:Flp pilus assembly protein TadG
MTIRPIHGRRKAASRGSAVVEAALIFLVFIVMLIAVFDFAQFLFIHQALVERTRSAARWGAIQDPADSASITNMVLYNQAAAPADGATGYFNLTPANVRVSNPGVGTDNYRLTVQVSGYSYTVLSPYIAGTYTGPPIIVSVPLGMFN